MLLALLAFLGGALTIVSPCILPVLPFVFARTEQSFVRSTLPLLLGMALTFAAIATLAAVGGSWAVRVNSYGRVIALVVLAVLGASLLSRHLAEWLSRPFVAMGGRLLEDQDGNRSGIWRSALLGMATGLVWAPCAGPILGLILTGAAINGPNAQTTLLLFAYACGSIVSLALATLAGGRILKLLKGSLGAGEWIRRGLGAAVLAGVVAIAFGWDTGLLTQLSFDSTNRIEQTLIDALPGHEESSGGQAMMMMKGQTGSMSGGMTGSMAMSGPASGPPIEGHLPPLDGAVGWINSPALTPESLQGKVVLIDFWTYSCINCLRAVPFVKAWYEHYKDQGLVVIGVHSPEFAFEKNQRNVQRAVDDLGIHYPVAIDNDFSIWQAFNNRYWPAHYFIDAQGQIRGHHFGEGNYDESEQLLRELLTDAGRTDLPAMLGAVKSEGVGIAADERNVASPETYIGYERAEKFSSPGGFVQDRLNSYSLPKALQLNQWALGGSWVVQKENALLEGGAGQIAFRFHARDLHLVLGSGSGGKPVRIHVTIDGKPPGNDRGLDVDANGIGVVNEQRLYQLIRQSGDIADRTFTIEFLDPGVEAFAFTFG